MDRPPIPLLSRFPPLSSLPRVALGTYPTPVVSAANVAPQLWIKRDDLSAEPVGGNKARALEFLLGGVAPGDSVVTVGSAGSTHALSVAIHGERLGARVLVGRWAQEMNDAARAVSSRIDETAESAPLFGSPVGAYAWAIGRRLRGARWIAAGGSTPLGVLGHVNAGLELVAQIDAGLVPMPRYVVAPLGTGGTIAGIALAFSIASYPITVVGARVVPRIVARSARVRRLADRTAALIEQCGGKRVPRVRDEMIVVAHEVFGGAYGRETPEGRAAAERARTAAGITLDATYSAKALGHAVTLAQDAVTLFWLTFDARALLPALTRPG